MRPLCGCGCGEPTKRGRFRRGHSGRVSPAKVCTFPGCDRKHYANGLCRSHDNQRRRGRDLSPVGDLSQKSARARAAWGRLSAAERRQRVAPMLSMHYTRTQAWRDAKSAEVKAKWATGEIAFGDIPCAACERVFTPASGSNVYCSTTCKRLAAAANKCGEAPSVVYRLHAAQNGRCAICGKKAALHVDHCHRTKKVRGLLCITCNTGLGKFGDSSNLLRKALAYLEG